MYQRSKAGGDSGGVRGGQDEWYGPGAETETGSGTGCDTGTGTGASSPLASNRSRATSRVIATAEDDGEGYTSQGPVDGDFTCGFLPDIAQLALTLLEQGARGTVYTKACLTYNYIYISRYCVY